MLPSPLFAFLEGGAQVKIEGAGRETRKPIVVFEKSVYRDKPSLITGNGRVGAVPDGPITAMDLESGLPIELELSTDPLLTDQIIFKARGPSSVEEEDDYTHTPMRQVPKLDTLVEFWDSETEVGLAMEMTVVTTIGSAIITVPNAELLTPGQTISDGGTLIPENTIILKILEVTNGEYPVLTKAVMSKEALDAGDAAAVLGGSNKVGGYRESEFIGWGSEISMPS
jgi:hypothetical protein